MSLTRPSPTHKRRSPCCADEARRYLLTEVPGFMEVSAGQVDRFVAMEADEYAEATNAAMNYGEGFAAARTAIYGQLVDRLWGCDSDANAVLNIVEGVRS